MHSWNSDHQLGRLMLFNLSRHSDHHYKASKKYQLLDSQPESPQMPTGYPGMMLLSLFPPLWFLGIFGIDISIIKELTHNMLYESRPIFII